MVKIKQKQTKTERLATKRRYRASKKKGFSPRANYKGIGEEVASVGVCRCGGGIDPQTREDCRLRGARPMCIDCYESMVDTGILASKHIDYK